MKVILLKPTSTILYTVSALLVLGKVSAQKTASLNPVTASSLGIAAPAQTPSAASQEKTVEQTRKNIKVLTGMPDSQLIPVMNFFATSMGRRCDLCHANPWESDDKPEKHTARARIKLGLASNKDNVPRNTQVR